MRERLSSKMKGIDKEIKSLEVGTHKSPGKDYHIKG